MICAGVDEAGRGTLAGPVIAAAVVLPQSYELPGLTDSKKLTPRRRETLFQEITTCAVDWAVGRADAEEVDAINVLNATLLAMRRALVGLDGGCDYALIDGNVLPELSIPARAVVGGDLTEPAISAASIIAKVTRDREMCALHEHYPAYGFDRHKGYATRDHVEALRRVGPCNAHRHTFAPVREAVDSARRSGD